MKKKDNQPSLLLVMIAMLIALSFINVVFLVTKMISDYRHEQNVENVCKEALLRLNNQDTQIKEVITQLNEWENTYEIIEVAE